MKQIIRFACCLSVCLLGCHAKKVTVLGPGHDADWPIESPNSKVYELTLQATHASQMGKTDEAISAFEEATKLEPNNAAIAESLATEYLKKGDLARAELLARKAIAADPNSRDAHFLLGKIFASHQDWNRAEDAFKKAMHLDPDNDEEVAIALATVYVESKRLSDAVTFLKDYTGKNQQSTYGFYYLGRVHSEMRNDADALVSYEKALSLNPSFVPAMKASALMYEAQGKKEKAISLFKDILELQPDNTGIRTHLSQMYLDNRDWDSARTQLETVVQEQPENLPARLRLGLLYLEQEDYLKAEGVFRKLLIDVPEKDRVHFYLGVTLEKKGDSEGALKELKQIGPESESYVEAQLTRAFIFERKKDFGVAEEVVRNALKKNPNHPDLLSGLATILNKAGKSEEARKLLVDATTKSPKDQGLWYSLAETYDKLKNFPKMEESMRKVIEINPDNASALNFLGYSYAERGVNLDEAEKLLRRALEIRPKDGYITDSLGWLYFQKKQYVEALSRLEEANRITPGEVVIMEHYADCLKAMKRLKEAKEMYEKAAAVAKEPDEKLRIQTKLKNFSK